MFAGSLKNIGGIEKYNSDLLNSLIKLNHKIILIERKSGGVFAKFKFLLNCIFQYIRHRPDYLICCHINFLPIIYYLKKIINVKYSISIYGIEIIPKLSSIKKKSIIDSDNIITISNYTKKLILDQLPNVEKKIFMLKSSISKNEFKIENKNKDKIQLLELDNKKIILTLARLSTDEDKGQHRVLEALPSILKKIPNAVYLIVGGGKDERVNQFLNQNPYLYKSVIFTGTISNEEKNDYYNLADVFVMPSKTEGFGIVFIEALACGLPVICSEGYGCREGLLNGKLGILVDPDNTKSISNRIVEILKKSYKASYTLRKKIRNETLKVYGMETWERNVAELLKLVEEKVAK